MDFLQIFGLSQYSFEGLTLAFEYSGKPRSTWSFLGPLGPWLRSRAASGLHRAGQSLYKLSNSGEKGHLFLTRVQSLALVDRSILQTGQSPQERSGPLYRLLDGRTLATRAAVRPLPFLASFS